MSGREKTAERLSEAGFAPFGVYLRRPVRTPDDGDPFHDYWHGTAASFFQGETLTTGYLEIRSHEPQVREMERHPTCAEVFVAVEGESVLAVADPEELAGAADKAQALRYFRLEPGDAVLIRRGVWHKLPVPAGERAGFLMLVPDRILQDMEKAAVDAAVPHF